MFPSPVQLIARNKSRNGESLGPRLGNAGIDGNDGNEGIVGNDGNDGIDVIVGNDGNAGIDGNDGIVYK